MLACCWLEQLSERGEDMFVVSSAAHGGQIQHPTLPGARVSLPTDYPTFIVDPLHVATLTTRVKKNAVLGRTHETKNTRDTYHSNHTHHTMGLVATTAVGAGSSCHADGSVVKRGELVLASIPCTWGAAAGNAAPTVRGNCAAASLLAAVEAGHVGKLKVELVIARYGNEDVSWSEPLSTLRTIYRKLPYASEDAATAGEANDIVGEASGEVLLRNVGKEAHTWVHHILHNYDTLAERTVFMHARRPSRGFFMASHQESRLLTV